MTRYDDLRAKWFALVDGMTVVAEADEIVDLADDLFGRFEHHDDAPEAADALIAAAAIVSGRTLITENWRDFHFIDDLSSFGHSRDRHRGSAGPRVKADPERRSSARSRMLPKAHPLPPRPVTAHPRSWHSGRSRRHGRSDR